MKVEDSDWGMGAFFLMIALLDFLIKRGVSTEEDTQRIFQAAIAISEQKGIQTGQSSLMRGAEVLHAVFQMGEDARKNRKQ